MRFFGLWLGKAIVFIGIGLILSHLGVQQVGIYTSLLCIWSGLSLTVQSIIIAARGKP